MISDAFTLANSENIDDRTVERIGEATRVDVTVCSAHGWGVVENFLNDRRPMLTCRTPVSKDGIILTMKIQS